MGGALPQPIGNRESQERVPGGQATQWWYPTSHPDVHEAFSYIACSLVRLTQLDREDRRSTQ